jgi:hypothetical protein
MNKFKEVNRFKLGDIAVCIEVKECDKVFQKETYRLTIGKKYTITASNTHTIGVIGDNGVETFPYHFQFKLLSDIREELINTILK